MSSATDKQIRQLREIFAQLKQAGKGLDFNEFESPEQLQEALKLWHGELARRGGDSLMAIEALIASYEEGTPIVGLADMKDIMDAKYGKV